MRLITFNDEIFMADFEGFAIFILLIMQVHYINQSQIGHIHIDL